MSVETDAATAHAHRLAKLIRDTVGVRVCPVDTGPVRSGAQDWASSGAMALTGRRGGPPLEAVGATASAVRGALAVFRALAPHASAALCDVDERLLGERAAILGLSRQGPRSAGGALVLYPTVDGWVGVNLPRRSDVELLPALTCGRVDLIAHGADLADWLAGRESREVLDRAQLLGMPIAAVHRRGAVLDSQVAHRWGGRSPDILKVEPGPRCQPTDRPLVVLLASLWAGPLAAHLLGLAGCRVVCVESAARPDGARRGPSAFHDLLHAGQEMVALDLPRRTAVRQLSELVAYADLVVDGSRPRAMEQLGVDVEAVVEAGTTWVSITGYGRTGPWANQPAFGDDAAVAGGLVAWDQHGPVPAGDAVADPLAGVHAAVAALAAACSGHSWLVDVAMRDVAAVAAALDEGSVPSGLTPPVLPPVARQPTGAAHGLGADTERVLGEIGWTS